MHRMTTSDWLRRTASGIKANYRKTRLWKIDTLKLGYISTPKCASSSIRSLLTEHQRKSSHTEKHHRKSDLKFCAKISLSPREIIQLRKEYYLFSFVRNPLTRLYSCYRDKVVNAAQRRDCCTLSPYRIHLGMSFDEFVSRTVEIPDKYADQHFRSASSFLVYQNELLVDYVGKFEHLNQDWEVISSQFNLAAPTRNKRISGATINIEDIPISPENLELIIKHYANDLDTFNYRDELEALLVTKRSINK